MNDLILMAELNGFQDLLDTTGRVSFGIKLSRHDIFEQLSSCYQVEDHVMTEIFLLFWRIEKNSCFFDFWESGKNIYFSGVYSLK